MSASTPSVAPTTTASPSGYAKSTASARVFALECSAAGCRNSATQGVATTSITTTPSIQRWSSKPGTRSRTSSTSAATISGYHASQKTSEMLVTASGSPRRLQSVSPMAQSTSAVATRNHAARLWRARAAATRHMIATVHTAASLTQFSRTSWAASPPALVTPWIASTIATTMSPTQTIAVRRVSAFLWGRRSIRVNASRYDADGRPP